MNDVDTDWDALEAEIDALLKLDPAARERHLAQMSRTHPKMAIRLTRWLRNMAQSQGFLETPVDSRHAGERLGPWQLVARIGQGGMGEVWRGERADGAFQRQVAIKFLRQDRPSRPEALVRERELLARLRHPGIAQLLDGGLSATGQPYLVTEWINGQGLGSWARAHPDRRQRVRLILSLAEALSYAHANLIVHRDLKPANVMVAEDGSPRLLDFGIARLIDRDQGLAETDDRAMTPAFATPEQVLGQPITTRTDVHGLGALLYWLLCERPPYALDDVSLAGLVRVIAEDEVPLLSRWISVDDDLQAVVHQALARDPADRYASVDAMASDLQRWLIGESVSVRVPSIPVRAWRFAKRHALPVGLSAALLLSAALGTAVSWRQAQHAEQARAQAVHAQQVAEADRQMAANELSRSQDLISLLAVTFADVHSATAGSADDWLNRAAANVDRLAGADPKARVNLLGKLAELEGDRGQPQRAVALYERLLGDQTMTLDAETEARSRCTLAQVRLDAGEVERAERDLRQGLVIARTLTGSARSTLVHCLLLHGSLAANRGVQPAHRQALAEAEAEIDLLPEREARAKRASLAYNLGVLDDLDGNFEAALAHYRDAVARDRELGHQSRGGTAVTLGAIAGILMMQGKLQSAEVAFREALTAVETAYGDSQVLAVNLANYAGLLNNLGQSDAAIAAAERALRILHELGIDSSITNANAQFEIAKAHVREGRLAPAATALAAARRLFDAAVGADHDYGRYTEIFRARVLIAEGKYEVADAILGTQAQHFRASSQTGGLISAESAQFASLKAQGKTAAAEAKVLGLIELERQRSGVSSWRTAWFEVDLIELWLAQGRDSEACKRYPLVRAHLVSAIGDAHARLRAIDLKTAHCGSSR